MFKNFSRHPFTEDQVALLEKAGVEFDVNPDGEDASFLSRANICPADGTALAITGWHEIAEELGLF